MASEEQQIDALVSDFSDAMRRKLHQKRHQDWSGWDDPDERDALIAKLRSHVVRASSSDEIPDGKQWIDVANFAAFLWWIDEAKWIEDQDAFAG